MTECELRRTVLELVSQYYDQAFPKGEFVPDQSPVPVAGRVFDVDDMHHLIEASLDFWLTTGRFAEQFERQFAQFMGVRHAILCNSGSSANLLAVTALTSPKLAERRLKPGDEVITVAAGFPTTVTPILQNRLTPVFLDIEPGTYNIDATLLEEAVSDRTKAVLLAHTLGNPFDLSAVLKICRRHNLWLIEDNCDAVGSLYDGQRTGSFGDLATVSFYPAHHITMGEGGAVLAKSARLKTLVESFRDWGRDCWCLPGKADTCGKRFDWQLGSLPYGYDHKYIYSHLGYNLKATDMQAAVGVAQLKKLPGFIAARRQNWQRLRDGLADLEEFFMLPRPTASSEPSWFGFALSVRPTSPFSRHDVVTHLEQRKIATRQLFAGNLLCQPAFRDVQHRVVGELTNTNRVMEDTFWIGVYPGISQPMCDFMLEAIHEFVASI